MDSKNIFIASNRFLQNVSWENSGTESEWKYCGLNEKIKSQTLESEMFSFFNCNELYLITNRNDSRIINLSECIEFLSKNLEKYEITFSNISFTAFMVFNKIGVYKLGKIKI